MNSFPKIPLVLIIIIDLFLSIIVLFLFQQETRIQTIIILIIFFYFVLSSLIMAVPSTLNYMINQFDQVGFLAITIISLILPYIAIILLGTDISETIISYTIWYVIPTAFLLISYISSLRNYNVILKIIGVLGLWIGFDHRYTSIIFDNFEGISYVFNSLWLASLILLSFGSNPTIIQPSQTNDQGIKPTLYGWNVGSIGSFLAAIIIIPVGLLTGFLSWNPQFTSIFNVFIGFIGIFMTIALQEELVFRAALLQEIDKYFQKISLHHIFGLLVVSLLFGLTHWNNEVPRYVPHYIILATVAGIMYGLCYRRSGLFGSMVAHTLIDLGWSLFLRRL